MPTNLKTQCAGWKSMFSRRSFFANSAAAATAIAASRADAQEACAVITKDMQSATTPEIAIQRLKEGNARFIAGKSVNCYMMAQVKATASG
jgi:carbonic anhydrase